MKYLKIGIDEIYAFAIIAFATGLRIILASQNWPPTNSDEATMGLMARHIAYRGEYPIVFYGQNYMGALRTCMGYCGSFTIKDLQRCEVIIAPAIRTEGKYLQMTQSSN